MFRVWGGAARWSQRLASQCTRSWTVRNAPSWCLSRNIHGDRKKIESLAGVTPTEAQKKPSHHVEREMQQIVYGDKDSGAESSESQQSEFSSADDAYTTQSDSDSTGSSTSEFSSSEDERATRPRSKSNKGEVSERMPATPVESDFSYHSTTGSSSSSESDTENSVRPDVYGYHSSSSSGSSSSSDEDGGATIPPRNKRPTSGDNQSSIPPLSSLSSAAPTSGSPSAADSAAATGTNAAPLNANSYLPPLEWTDEDIARAAVKYAKTPVTVEATPMDLRLAVNRLLKGSISISICLR